ncbi:MAG: glutamine-hydrolyzing GMP synthase [Candidatus Aenigmarchaeota archaeon]|nr:glutamine-hydrolyzing GMP synthase [Candidatus Aenigmarchaeota archaeon]
MIAILDFGGQYVFNIKRNLNEMGFEAEVFPFDVSASLLKRKKVTGVILSGGPYSVYEKDAPVLKEEILELDVPILGICYGHQLLATLIGGKVSSGLGEYGFTEVFKKVDDVLFNGWEKKEICWMSHGDRVESLPSSAKILASTGKTKIAAFVYKKLYGVQFHPEVSHTPKGHILLKNFAQHICGEKKRSWDVKSFVERSIKMIRKTVNGSRAVVAVSGGIDSTTLCLLGKRALGSKLIPIHIDTGFMRKNESEKVVNALSSLGLDCKLISAQEEFFQRVKDVEDLDERRRVIGEVFIRILERVSKDYGCEWLLQGTIAPDVIESTRGQSKRRKKSKHGGWIKLHHNVGGLPKDTNIGIIEPLRELFKYQVRLLAKHLGLPEEFLRRQPFPGPGLACRIGGKITREKVELLKEVTDIAERELKKFNPSQYFAAIVEDEVTMNLNFPVAWRKKWFVNRIDILSQKSIGVKGDERLLGQISLIKPNDEFFGLDWLEVLKLQSEVTSFFKDVCRAVVITNESKGKYGIVLRAVDTKDFMTAMPTEIEWGSIKRLGEEIISKFPTVSFVGYEITTKPPSTIELF